MGKSKGSREVDVWAKASARSHGDPQQVGVGSGCLLALAMLPVTALTALLRKGRLEP